MRCPCGGDLTLIYRDLVRSSATGEEVRVQHVPHLICSRCGRTILTPETEQRITAALSLEDGQRVALFA